MKILVDMNLAPTWCQVLAARGYSATHWSNVGKPTATDREIMDWARDNEYIVFTHDLDFGAILAATQAASPSVIQIRTQDPMPQHMEEIVCRALSQFASALSLGAIVVVDESRTRVRILPLRP
jgi:predicted nuclease of predicted toxin-antitoxin system